MSFTGDFDIFVYQGENEEEAYAFPFPSPLYIFLIQLSFFEKKTEKKSSFFGENGCQIIGQFFLEFCSELQLSILFPLVVPIFHFLQGKKSGQRFSSHFSKKLMAAIFSQKKLIIFLFKLIYFFIIQ